MRLTEAHTMRFIAENTTIPVPKVYAAFEHNDQVYIVMERTKGKPVSHGWLQRSAASKTEILSQLKTMVDQLRAIPAPAPPPESRGGPGRVCDILGGPISDDCLPDTHLWGPFASIDAFHRALRSADETDPLYDAGTARVPWISEMMAFQRAEWPEPVLTHGRLAARAVRVRGDEVVALLDWESAGWMPPYWEYTSAWHANPTDRVWREEVGRFVTPWPDALAMEIVRRGYFGGVYERF